MANRPADAGSGSVGTGRGLAPMGNTAPPLGPVAPPPPDAVAPPPPRHHDVPRTARRRAEAPRADAPRTAAGHRAARSRESRSARDRAPGGDRAPARDRNPANDRNDPVASGLAWVPYLIVLAGAASGMFVAWQGSRYAGWGAGLLGCSLLVAGLARLILPPRYAGLLSTRRKASDVLAFAVFGAAVIAVALMLP